MKTKGKFKTNGNLLHIYNSECACDMLNQDLLGVIQHSNDAVCVADGDSRMLLLNPAFENVMGVKNSECIGKRITDMVQCGISDTAASIKIMESGNNETVLINMASGRRVISTGTPIYNQEKKIHRIFCSLRRFEDANLRKEDIPCSLSPKSSRMLDLNWIQRSGKESPLLVTHNKEMMRIAAFAHRMAQVDSSVLILGESGVGKDLMAHLIHDASPRHQTGKLIKVNCGAIPEHLLESELFGYESGAFTGASRNGKAGFLELADKGTLFLDEIGELPPSLQVKLLSVLQDGTFRRLGGTRSVTCDFRLLTATNQDLEKMVRNNRFREDLYFRINVVPLRIIPLRERPDEIPYLIRHFLWIYNSRYGLKAAFDEMVIAHLCEYPWPGNVRELQNLVERLVVTSVEPLITKTQLPGKYRNRQMPSKARAGEFRSLKEAVSDFELRLIGETVSMTATHEEAAAKLGVSMSTLTRRLRKIKTVNPDGQF